MNDVVTFAVVGCGGRLRDLVGQTSQYERIQLRGGWDPDPTAVDKLVSGYGTRSPGAKRYANYEELLNDSAIQWVFVGSPNVYHAAQIRSALEAGKHVFAEKPLATEIGDASAIVETHRRTDRLFVTGFTLRYSPLYRTAKSLISSGTIGRIVSIDATENLFPFHGAYIMTNWRRYRELAGANILEKCVHDLDILNWLCDSLPIRVAAFGGNSMFIPENADLFDRCPQFKDWPATTASGLNPFTTEKTIEDHMVSILEFANGVRAQFQLTSSNPLGERRMYISGTEGTIKLDIVTSDLVYRTLHESRTHVLDNLGNGNMHGGGDEVMIHELVETMLTEREPVCGGAEGLRSAVVATALEQAWKERRIVDLREIWQDLEIEP